MLTRIRAAGLVWPTILTLTGLTILVSLGTWQMSRKAWKDALVQRIEARMKAEPQSLDAVMGTFTASHAEGLDDGLEYTRMRVTGKFRHDREQYLYAPHPKLGPGVHVLTPFEVTGPSKRLLVVNRGYVPDAARDRAKRPGGLPTVETTITGLVRLPGEKGSFTPANEPVKNLWYWRDLPALVHAALPGEERAALPFMIDAEAEPASPGGWPQGGTTIVKLPNRHLEYALTWYGLAMTLAGVYLVYTRGRLRAARDDGTG